MLIVCDDKNVVPSAFLIRTGPVPAPDGTWTLISLSFHETICVLKHSIKSEPQS